ncbi:MAG: methyltransferase domain-containing protein [Clostridia bacterium]|nr:MAG: methyltransferase domain-containing protein [Clostridia bacterium]
MKEAVRRVYREALTRAEAAGAGSPGGGGSLAGGDAPGPLPDSSCCTTDLGPYAEVLARLPQEARNMTFGCGNPLAVARLEPGETVVDVGCGAGLDLILAALRIGPGGRVIGVDFTPEMLERAAKNAAAAGVTNVLFLEGEAERLPLEDAVADTVISNCVLNLVADKAAAFREIARCLKPGGRIIVSDIVAAAELPPEIRTDPELWASCIGGAIPEAEYLRLWHEAGLRGLTVLKRSAVDTRGVRLFSITLEGIRVGEGDSAGGDPAAAGHTAARPVLPVLLDVGHGLTALFNPAYPAWALTDAVGRRLAGEPGDEHAPAKAGPPPPPGPENEVHLRPQAADFLAGLQVRQLLFPGPDYQGRDRFLQPGPLRELWLHVTQDCNLRCRHCLVEAGQGAEEELSLEDWLAVAAEAVQLGAERFYLTGGEPFRRGDAVQIIRELSSACEVVVLTNGTLVPEIVAGLPVGAPITFQVSLEGPPAVHEALRGQHSFARAVAGIRALKGAGFRVVAAATLIRLNRRHLAGLVDLVAGLGLEDLHVLWLHRRGRAAGALADLALTPGEVGAAMAELSDLARRAGLTLDNEASLAARLASPAGTRHDLCQAGVDCLAVGPRGTVYPCASLVGVEDFACGSLQAQTLEEIWRQSPRIQSLRALSLVTARECRVCVWRFYCGGGCPAYKFQAGGGDLAVRDPYCEAYQALARLAMGNLAARQADGGEPGLPEPVTWAGTAPASPPGPAGFRLFGGSQPGAGETVQTYRCACVLSSGNHNRLGQPGACGPRASSCCS